MHTLCTEAIPALGTNDRPFTRNTSDRNQEKKLKKEIKINHQDRNELEG